MSDLQCAATVLLVPEGEAADDDGLAASLANRNVALVYSGTQGAAARSARRLAEALGVSWRHLPGAEDPAEDDPDGLRSRCHEALTTVADQHRGETVLVVASCAVTTFLLGASSLDALGGTTAGRPADVAELLVDGDGWVLRRP